jgi:hypothetical protein
MNFKNIIYKNINIICIVNWITVKLSNLMRTRNSIRLISKIRQNEIELLIFFLIFFQILMIRFGRIELAIYRIKN